MRKFSGVAGTVGLSLAIAMGLAVSAWAHDSKDTKGGQDKGSWCEDCGMGGGMGQGMGPMDHMKKRLDLSDDQESKIKELFKSQMEDMKPLREKMKITMDTLRLKLDSKASDSEIGKILDDLSAGQKKMEENRKAMRDKLSDILTPTQRAKMLIGMRSWKGKGKMGMMKHRMGVKGGNHPDKDKSKGDDK